MSNANSPSYVGPMERVFRDWVKVKHPSLGEGKEMGELRLAFFVGVWSMMGKAQTMNNLNPSRGEELFKEIYAETKSTLDPLNYHNVHGIIVPRPNNQGN